MDNLGELISRNLAAATALKTSDMGLRNAERNKIYFSKTIDELPLPKIESLEEMAKTAIVIVAGPSLYRKDSIRRIVTSKFVGNTIATDASLGHCLRNNLIPDYLLSLDPHPHRVVRWFGDTELYKRPADDYYSRQDLDPAHWEDEVGYNQKLIELVNRHGSKIKIILSTSVDPSVTKRCIESEMDIYWWNPVYDDFDKPDSVTRKLYESNGIPCMVTGGNVGTAAWVFANIILRKKEIAFVGMDLGYAPGTPLINTQCYYELKELLGDRLAQGYISITNPFLNETWYTDPPYYWYKNVLLDLVHEAQCTTYNCTEGGILFEIPLKFIPLSEFLNKFRKEKKDGQDIIR